MLGVLLLSNTLIGMCVSGRTCDVIRSAEHHNQRSIARTASQPLPLEVGYTSPSSVHDKEDTIHLTMPQ